MAALLSQISLEIPEDVSIGDRITITVNGEYERYAWDVKRINLDGGELHLEDVEQGALKINNNTVDFTTKVPGSYRFFVSAANETEIVQTIGQLNLDYDDEFVNRKADIVYEPNLGAILDVGKQMPTDPNSIEGQILNWTLEVDDYKKSQSIIAEYFREQADKLERGQVKSQDTLKNAYQRAKSELNTADFNNWRPWFRHINDLCQDYGTSEARTKEDWVPILRGIGEEVSKVE